MKLRICQLCDGNLPFSVCSALDRSILTFSAAEIPNVASIDMMSLQTETPDQLKKANDEAKKGDKRKVVKRDAVCVISQGTLNDPSMVLEDPHAMYVATAVEILNPDGGVTVGFCAADVAASRVIVGQFQDTRLRSRLLKHCTGMSSTSLCTVPTQAFIIIICL